MPTSDALHLHELHCHNWGNTAPSPVKFSATGGLQLVLGPNEAGKTTLMRAIRGFVRGLLAGDPAPRSLQDAEVRARVQLGGTERWLLRRGRDRAGAPLRDDAGAVVPPELSWPAPSQVVYDSLFCLDHDTLREGGRQLGRSDTGELGTLLFATLADAGRLIQLKKDGDSMLSSLFSPAGNASKPLVNKAIRGFTDSDKTLRREQVTHERQGKLRRELDEAEAGFERADEAWNDADRRLRALGDLVNHLPTLVQFRENEAGQAAVRAEGPTPDQVWATQAREAQEKLRAAEGTLEAAKVGHADRVEQLAAVNVDEAVLAREAEIRHAHGLLPGFGDARAALPAAKLRLETAHPAWEVAMCALGVAPESSPPLPTETDLAELRAALDELLPALATEGEAGSAVDRAEQALGASTAGWDPTVPAPQASTSLVDALAAARLEQAGTADRAARAAGLERDVAGLLRDAQAQRLSCVSPDALRALPLPSPDRRREWAARLQQQMQAVQAAEVRSAQNKAERAALESEIREGGRHTGAPSAAALQALRDARDLAIQVAFSEPAAPSTSAWKSVAAADQAADQRYQEAEALGALEARQAQMERLESQAGEALEALQSARAARVSLDAEWASEAVGLGLPAISLGELSSWVEAVQDLKGNEAALRVSRTALANEETQALARFEHLRAVLEPLRADPKAALPVAPSALLDAAESVRDRLAEAVVVDQGRRAAWQAAQDNVAEARRQQEVARKACAAPREKWAKAQAVFDPDKTISPTGGRVWIDQLTAAREASQELAAAREAVNRLEGRISSFETAAAALADLADPHLPADARTTFLWEQFELETHHVTARSTCIKELDQASTALANATDAATAARETLDELVAEAGLAGPEAVDAARDRATRLGGLHAQADVLLVALGDTTPDEVEAAVAGRSLEALRADEAAAGATRQGFDDARTAARESVRTAKAAFDAVDGTAAAAEAAQARADHQSAGEEAVQQLLLERACAYLTAQLQDELSRDAQTGPVDRAGEVFSTLTLGGFQGLQVEQRDEGGAHLRYVSGLRSNGERVAPQEMSDGTRDALWLSLRVAAIESLLEQGHRVPVVLDDVAVHLDDQRTRAMLQVFGELAEKTQVLLFTHHRAVVEAASAAGVPHEILELEPRSPDAPPMNLNPPDPGPRPTSAAGAAPSPATKPRTRRRTATPTVDLTAIIAHLRANPEGCGKGALVEAGLVEPAEWSRVRVALEESGQVKTEGQKRGRRYMSVD